ncbi:peptidoglycan-binding domain-containing protein [Flavobacterium sp. ZB4P13]|uniref:peptidoglycan-binding domain-containing protein n=1 Tax=Flavobacterium sp. ZB4P13 TaxID=3401728 RepID=UPI003AB08475
MKVSDDDKMLIGAGVLALGGLGFLFWKKKKNEQKHDELANYTPETEEVAPTSGSGSKPAQGATLDRNKLLKVGSKGLEVRELQRLLGVEIDGDFGAKETLPALQNAKGVSETSLNAFATTVKKKVTKPLKAVSPPKVGQKLMAAKDDTVIFNSKKIASGAYTNTGQSVWGKFNYGDALGTYVGANVSGFYLIKMGTRFYYVKSNEVKTY